MFARPFTRAIRFSPTIMRSEFATKRLAKTGNQLISDLTFWDKYAKHLPDLGRRESRPETMKRVLDMHLDFYAPQLASAPQLAQEIKSIFHNEVATEKVWPAGRSLQFAGKPLLDKHPRMYNCSYVALDDINAIGQTLYLLMCGSGVGFSVRQEHITKLPKVQIPRRTEKWVIHDSIEGWADAVHALVFAAFGVRYKMPEFDYTAIRPQGSSLSSGGTAAGPEAIRETLTQIEAILREWDQFKLPSWVLHRVMCILPKAVVVAGVRRSSQISLFSWNDQEMAQLKSGDWYKTYPEYANANNSVVCQEKTGAAFEKYWHSNDSIRIFGEPGILFRESSDFGINPCGEASLRNRQFCNLVEANITKVRSQAEFLDVISKAVVLNTFQAGYTNFDYLDRAFDWTCPPTSKWSEQTREDALLGTGLTGIASNPLFKTFDLKAAGRLAIETNKRVAKLLGIQPAARIGLVKPSGTSSLCQETTSGIHPDHAPFYVRNFRFPKNSPIVNYFTKVAPELLAEELINPKRMVLSLPWRAPEGAITRLDERAIDNLERIKFTHDWVMSSHTRGEPHSISATVSFRPDEPPEILEWVKKNIQYVNGISFLPMDIGKAYPQAPREDVPESKIISMEKLIERAGISIEDIEEINDTTDMLAERACAGGVCSI